MAGDQSASALPEEPDRGTDRKRDRGVGSGKAGLWPGEGSHELTKRGMSISPAGVRGVWLRHDLQTFQRRLKAREGKAAQDHRILTEDQVRALERAQEEKPARGQIETAHPG